MTNKQVIAFNKKFAAGAQNAVLDSRGITVPLASNYFWREDAVYNQVGPIVETFTAECGKLFKTKQDYEKAVYGKNGLVDRLVSLQIAYNAARNRKCEYMERLSCGIIIAEDGSIDVDEVSYEGIAPGGVLIYRQGSTPPTIVKPSVEEGRIYDNEIESLYCDMLSVARHFKALCTNTL